MLKIANLLILGHAVDDFRNVGHVDGAAEDGTGGNLTASTRRFLIFVDVMASNARHRPHHHAMERIATLDTFKESLRERVLVFFIASRSWLTRHRFLLISFSFAKLLLIFYWAKYLSEKVINVPTVSLNLMLKDVLFP